MTESYKALAAGRDLMLTHHRASFKPSSRSSKASLTWSTRSCTALLHWCGTCWRARRSWSGARRISCSVRARLASALHLALSGGTGGTIILDGELMYSQHRHYRPPRCCLRHLPRPSGACAAGRQPVCQEAAVDLPPRAEYMGYLIQ